MSDTPETDAAIQRFHANGLVATVDPDFARKLERERDEALEKLADWENAAKHVEADHPDEVHCGCVPVLRKLLADAQEDAKRATYDAAQETIKVSTVKSHWIEACRERDEARAKIERQAERIRYLEGATNHACGTPLSIALRERDEAREALEKAKTALRLIAEEGGTTHDTECGPLRCDGYWCADQARWGLFELEDEK